MTRLVLILATLAPWVHGCGAADEREPLPTVTDDGKPIQYERYTSEFNVDCLGMSVTALSGTSWGTTRAPLAGDLTVSEAELAEAYEGLHGEMHAVTSVPRCGYWFEPDLEAGPVDLLTLDNFTFNTKGTGMLKIAYDGRMWTPYFGDVVLTGQPSNAKAEGYYDAIFTNAGEFARIHGRFEWCEPATGEDCAAPLEGDLPYAFEVQMPGRNPISPFPESPTFGWGRASECRVVIDENSGGMQMDMQVAFWKGVGLTQLYAGYCTSFVDVMNANHFTFRTGGVTGPGSYGPVGVHAYDTVTLPELDFETPFSFLYAGSGIAPAGFCALSQGGLQRGHARTTEDSECTYEIVGGEGEDPGEIRITCSDVDHEFPGGEINNNGRGVFDLWARCDVLVR